MKYLYRFTDPGKGVLFLDRPGWIVHTISLSEDLPRDYSALEAEGVQSVGVLVWGRGSEGTITSRDSYASFANLCSIYVKSSPGCYIWVIGNEPNSPDSWPDGMRISPEDYAECFKLCRDAIKKVKSEDQVMIASMGSNDEDGLGILFFDSVIRNLDGHLDGFASNGQVSDFSYLPPSCVDGDAVPAAASPTTFISDTIMIKQAEYLREDEVILALRSALGNIDIASKALGLSRGQLQDYIVNHPSVREERNQIKEAIKDEAEDLLIQRMRVNDNLLMFFLRTQARDRGYEPNLSIVGSDGKSMSVSFDARSLISAMRQGSTIETNGDESKESAHSDSNGAGS